MVRLPSISTIGLAAASVAFILGGLTFVMGTLAPAVGELRYGFPAYYTSARLAIDGHWGPDVYDNAWFSARTLELTDNRIAEIFRPNTPMMSLLAIPTARLDILTARRIWLAADVGFIVIALIVLFRAFPALRSPPWVVAVSALFLWWAPLRETVGLGQAYALMLGLQAVALWALMRERADAAGRALGIAAATKLAALPVVLLLAVRRSWRAVLVALGGVVVLAALTLDFASADSWARFVAVLADDTFRPPASLSVTAYQSATGLFQHLFVPDPEWNPGAVANLPGLAAFGAVAATVVALGVTLWLGRSGRLDLAVGAAIVVGALVLDLAQEYHFAVLLAPAVVALAHLVDAPRRRPLDLVWFVVALVLLAAPLAYEDPALSTGWVALLAYPRLYGAWLLWAWLIRALWLDRSRRPAPHEAAPAR